MEPPTAPPARPWRWLRRRAPRLFAELLVVLAVLLAAEYFLTRDAARGEAPAFSGRTVAGAPFDLAQLRGEPAVVYFWATWCPVCSAQKGAIDAVAEDHPLISVAMQSGGDSEVRKYLREGGVAFAAVNDPDGRIALAYGVRGVPAAFVLDSRGEVAFVTRGYTTGWGLRLRLWLADLF